MNAESDAPTCALLLPRKRGEWAECRHGEVVAAGGDCKYGPTLAATFPDTPCMGERDA